MEDISNIRVTEKNNEFLNKLVSSQKLFKDDKSAAMFAISYAIEHNLDEKIDDSYTLELPVINKWDANSIDSSEVFRLLIQKRHPSSVCPFRIIQGTLDLGLRALREIAPDSGYIELSKFIKD